MKNKNSLIALTVGLLSGALSFYLLYQKASEIERKSTPVQVLVASRYIASGSALRSDLVEKKSIPDAFVSPSAIHDIQEVEGLINLVPISAGEQILANKFTSGENSLSLSLSPGYRAYTLEVSETTGVGNLVHPGNHVDVLTKIETNKRESTAFVFQNLLVLAAGQKTDFKKTSNSNSGPTTPNENDSPNSYSTVTLAVTPEEAEVLMFLEGHPLRLVLRASNDTEIVAVPSQSESEVVSKLGRSPAKKRD